MKRSLKMSFRCDEHWATVCEALRRLRKTSQIHDPTEADLIAELCREYLDRPIVNGQPAGSEKGAPT